MTSIFESAQKILPLMTGGKLGSALYSAEIFCTADRHGSGNVRAVLYQLVYDIRLLSSSNRFSRSLYRGMEACCFQQFSAIQRKNLLRGNANISNRCLPSLSTQ